MFNSPFEVEHVTPVSGGGGDDPDNLALACRACNGFKAARRSAPDPDTQQAAPLFHPRRDLWPAHFAVDPETLGVAGLTSTGRATAAALQLNSPL